MHTCAVSPVGVVQAMGEVVRKMPLEKVKSVTGLPSSSTTACHRSTSNTYSCLLYILFAIGASHLAEATRVIKLLI